MNHELEKMLALFLHLIQANKSTAPAAPSPMPSASLPNINRMLPMVQSIQKPMNHGDTMTEKRDAFMKLLTAGIIPGNMADPRYRLYDILSRQLFRRELSKLPGPMSMA